ncbi:MAG TPA: zeta toxin family protein [Pyrinomonadaceae bacterium]|nr:zeta toxin family protein [Pyrinomonadaceae bacterium]
MPDVVIIAGPNGAGKSTLAPHLLRDGLGIYEYVNADTIAQGLSAFAPESAAMEAGRVMLERLKGLAKEGRNFAFETTLATRFYSKWLRSIQQQGYNVHLVYLWLSSPELAIERVAARVRDGGHNIPMETIRRRYERGLDNFFKLYQPFVDSWEVLDVSEDSPKEVAFGDKMNGWQTTNESIWKLIQR